MLSCALYRTATRQPASQLGNSSKGMSYLASYTEHMHQSHAAAYYCSRLRVSSKKMCQYLSLIPNTHISAAYGSLLVSFEIRPKGFAILSYTEYIHQYHTALYFEVSLEKFAQGDVPTFLALHSLNADKPRGIRVGTAFGIGNGLNHVYTIYPHF